ncbi:MAG: T9SS type A sorting domain-containing protein [Bacteroidetes bacterium]|nr:T9SS type A sorting domain-containing protein [Bacteroidota bacterium]
MVDRNNFYLCGTDFVYPEGNEYPIGPQGIIYKTTNGGLNWSQSLRGGFTFYDINFFDQDEGAVIAGSLLRTTTGGQNWYYVSSAPAEGRMTNPFVDTFYIYDKNGGVIRTTNNGLSFSNLQTNNSKRLRGISFVDCKYGFVVGDTGIILRTTNAGNNWTSQISGTNQQLNGVWFLNKDTGFAVGNNGLILTTYTGGLASVKKYLETVPGSFNLYQNYPNPFNPTTNIRFDIHKTSYTKLIIYDILGKEVATLVNEKLNAGSYEVDWNGSGYPSGVYFYKLSTDEFAIVKKMILVK